VVERDPGLGPPAGAGEAAGATYRALGPQRARVEVVAPAPGILLVRTPFDPGWRATVDGRPARVIPVDYLDQGVVLQAGRHVVELSYHDPSIGYGLAGSAGSLAALLGAALYLHLRRREEGAAQGPP
jgi:uncharacterized membrane protein YfhO